MAIHPRGFTPHHKRRPENPIKTDSPGMNRRRFIGSLTLLGAGMLGGAFETGSCRRRRQTAYPELEARGRPGDLGLKHGRIFSRQIEYNLSFYLQWLSQAGRVPEDHLRQLAASFVPVIEDRFPALIDEMDGIARGAGRSLTEIALLNARTDISAIVEREVEKMKTPACTSLALFGHERDRTLLALGQNWDWDPLMAGAPVVLRLTPADAPRLVTLVEAGMVAKIGFNQHRLGVCLNFLSHVSDGPPGRFGIPIHCLLRVVLTQDTLEGAIDAVDGSPRCASANFLMAQHADGGPRALDLEITPEAIAVLNPENDHLVHTNHFLDPALAAGCTSGRGPSTMNRYATALKLAEYHRRRAPDPVQRMKRVLVSREGLPYPISRDCNPDPSSSSLAGVIMDLTRNRFILTQGPPHRNPWIDRPGTSASPLP